MDTSELTNEIVKNAFDALQEGDNATWSSLFTPDAELYDDGSPRDLKAFNNTAIGHERFTSIDKVENDGKDIYGQFHSDQWGDFKVYFKFHIDHTGKIHRLDIGQAG
ncbi:hypothetical protein [Sinomicrobium weinanense]|uniref:Nuclear transport factor 2 family protein n=1 Tax=Sinomicrobium weinanense TaxID=2842200 RepID=A0A926JU34_9FLAO|nr:hypothetical protein [Sinomicrobium weinanense]MBC9797339.1 hypothetical protein [Sinomicrobium weinanense]MBU3124519.1 hypothetical protein [Sinomicrobium weinanense]